MSVVWTLGLAGVLFGHLNLLTCIFSCVLAGLGIDFAIHIVNRFYSPEKKGTALPERLQATLREAGSGIMIGALTTAMAFYAVGISDFRGFRELGIMTGSGLLLCLAAMLFVLPALLVRSEVSRPTKPINLAGFGLPAVISGMGRRPGLMLIAVCTLILGLAWMGLKINFDDNLKNFRAPDNQAIQLQEQMTQWLGGSSAASLLVIKDRSEITLLNRGTAIWKALQELKKTDQVADISGLPGFLPSPAAQMQNLAFVHNHAEAFNRRRIQHTFNQALAANDLKKLPAYDTYFNMLETAFTDTKPFLPSDLMDTPLAPLIQTFGFQAEGDHHLVLYVRPKANLWSQQQSQAFKQAVESRLTDKGFPPDQYTLTGAQMLSAELKKVILNNLQTALLLAVTAIVLVLLVYYRSFWLLLGALAPLVTALGMLVGLMALLGIDFNFVNVIVLPMIVGIGIDDGVHLTNTFLANGRKYNDMDLAGTGRGVVLTSLTTIVGFGSISLSHYPGLKSMGYVAALGVALSLFTSLFLLLPLLAIASKKEH
jgi:predicted RND superfamily exporter protein